MAGGGGWSLVLWRGSAGDVGPATRRVFAHLPLVGRVIVSGREGGLVGEGLLVVFAGADGIESADSLDEQGGSAGPKLYIIDCQVVSVSARGVVGDAHNHVIRGGAGGKVESE